MIEPLHDSIKNNNQKAFEYLLKSFQETKDNDINAFGKDGQTALHLAVSSKNSFYFDSLLKTPHINITAPNESGIIPLVTAIDENKPEFIKRLFPLSDYLDEKNFKACTASFHKTIQSQQEEMVHTLLETGIDPNLTTTDTVESSLHVGIDQGNINIIQDLLEHFANPFLIDLKNQTPLDRALNILNQLNQNSPKETDYSYRSWAENKNKYEHIIKLLFSYGCGIGFVLPKDLGPLEVSLNGYALGTLKGEISITPHTPGFSFSVITKEQLAQKISTLMQLHNMLYNANKTDKELQLILIDDETKDSLTQRLFLEQGLTLKYQEYYDFKNGSSIISAVKQNDFNAYKAQQREIRTLLRSSVLSLYDLKPYPYLFQLPFSFIERQMRNTIIQNPNNKELAQLFKFIRFQTIRLKRLLFDYIIEHFNDIKNINNKLNQSSFPLVLKNEIFNLLSKKNSSKLFDIEYPVTHPAFTIAQLKQWQKQLENFEKSLENHFIISYKYRIKQYALMIIGTFICFLIFCFCLSLLVFHDYLSLSKFTKIGIGFILLISFLSSIIFFCSLIDNISEEVNLTEDEKHLLKTEYKNKIISKLSKSHAESLQALGILLLHLILDVNLEEIIKNIPEEFISNITSQKYISINENFSEISKILLELKDSKLKIHDLIEKLHLLSSHFETLYKDLEDIKEPDRPFELSKYAGISFFPANHIDRLPPLIAVKSSLNKMAEPIIPAETATTEIIPYGKQEETPELSRKIQKNTSQEERRPLVEQSKQNSQSYGTFKPI